MTIRSLLTAICQQEDLNFLLTNRIPRAAFTRFMGWFSKLEHPLIRDLSIAVWRLFSDLDLREAKKSQFFSLHDCFIRELKDGARPIDADPAVLVSPCDAIIGASGKLDDITMLQAKGFVYSLDELVGDPVLARHHRNGQYVTLRLTSSMYHRFHAPHDCRIEQVTYISGDTWNVNPIALRRVERLFCKNERAVVRTRLAETSHVITLVPVAAILVASIRFHFLDVLLNMKYRGPNVCHCAATMRKGEELGWFEHGSTIIVLVPAGFSLCDDVKEGAIIQMGQPLMRLPAIGNDLESRGNAPQQPPSANRMSKRLKVEIKRRRGMSGKFHGAVLVRDDRPRKRIRKISVAGLKFLGTDAQIRSCASHGQPMPKGRRQ